MTAQISDTVVYDDIKFALCGVNGNGLFEPQNFGLEPVMISTACWRGFFCTYQVDESFFKLRSLTIRIANIEQRLAQSNLEIYGCRPGYDNSERRLDYKNIDQVIDFTGGILIGNDFIHEMYVHMGFHPAYKFREVFEIIIEKGVIKSIDDRSMQMLQVREKITDLRPTAKDRKALEDWIQECFKLNYYNF